MHTVLNDAGADSDTGGMFATLAYRFQCNLRAVTDPRVLLVVVAALVIFPICLTKDFARLAKFSGLSLMAVLFMVVAVVVEHRRVPDISDRSEAFKYFEVHNNFFPSIGTIGR